MENVALSTLDSVDTVRKLSAFASTPSTRWESRWWSPRSSVLQTKAGKIHGFQRGWMENRGIIFCFFLGGGWEWEWVNGVGVGWVGFFFLGGGEMLEATWFFGVWFFGGGVFFWKCWGNMFFVSFFGGWLVFLPYFFGVASIASTHKLIFYQRKQEVVFWNTTGNYSTLPSLKSRGQHKHIRYNYPENKAENLSMSDPTKSVISIKVSYSH